MLLAAAEGAVGSETLSTGVTTTGDEVAGETVVAAAGGFCLGIAPRLSSTSIGWLGLRPLTKNKSYIRLK